MNHNHTPDDPRIFVFGSNLLGIHGAGAARYAHEKLGAIWGVAFGWMGRSFAIPTCQVPGISLPLDDIARFVKDFLYSSRSNPEKRFFVSAIGCGLAGFSEKEIAPLFANAPENCDLPPGWR